ncbi:UNVERIFIED_CONTAM: hypothetical protein HDU68_012814 [Siphonaria sp. JEL0065]|nr:hypothetical protein HDU68_012814 [Siphonaria sp. JEL0065]
MGKKKGGKKEKKEKGGKGGKSAGKKKKGGGDPDAPVPDAIPIEQTKALLVLLTRDLLKKQRAKLDNIGKNEYFSVKKMGQNDKDLESTILQLQQQAQEYDIGKSLADEVDDDNSTLGVQRRQMAEIHNHIEKLEDELERTVLHVQDLQDFDLSGGSQHLEAIAATLKQQLRQKWTSNLLELEKIQRRHDASLIATVKRKDRILAQLEARANQQELENMSLERMKIFQKNSSLKEKVAVLQKEQVRLTGHVQELEEYNMKLVNKTFDLDWNLMYGKEDEVIGDAPPSPTTLLEPLPPVKKAPPTATVPKYSHLRLTDVDKAVAQVLMRQEEWQTEDLMTFGVIGTIWEPRKPNPRPDSSTTFITTRKSFGNHTKLGAIDSIGTESSKYESLVSVMSSGCGS